MSPRRAIDHLFHGSILVAAGGGIVPCMRVALLPIAFLATGMLACWSSGDRTKSPSGSGGRGSDRAAGRHGDHLLGDARRRFPRWPICPNVAELPDPFLSLDGTRITRADQWACRRAEIAAQAAGVRARREARQARVGHRCVRRRHRSPSPPARAARRSRSPPPSRLPRPGRHLALPRDDRHRRHLDRQHAARRHGRRDHQLPQRHRRPATERQLARPGRVLRPLRKRPHRRGDDRLGVGRQPSHRRARADTGTRRSIPRGSASPAARATARAR